MKNPLEYIKKIIKDVSSKDNQPIQNEKPINETIRPNRESAEKQIQNKRNEEVPLQNVNQRGRHDLTEKGPEAAKKWEKERIQNVHNVYGEQQKDEEEDTSPEPHKEEDRNEKLKSGRLMLRQDGIKKEKSDKGINEGSDTKASVFGKRVLKYNELDIIRKDLYMVRSPANVLLSLNRLTNQTGGTVYTYNREFVVDSLKYADMPGDPDAKYISFMQYYPTFYSMSTQQKQWYFYWREQVVNGNYPRTDTSYIFLFAYELINYSFNRKAAVNISLLIRLNEEYKKTNPELFRYLPQWIGHMLLEAGETEKAKEWIGATFSNYQYDKLMNATKEFDDWSKISFSVWKPYIQKSNETAFFSQYRNRIYKLFKSGVEMYRGYCAGKGISLEEVWFSRRQENMKIAIYERSNVYRENQTADFEAERIVPEERVYDELTALLKHAENILRSKEGNSSRVQVQENVLPKEFLELMEVQLTSRFTKVQAGSNKSGTRIPLPQKRIERRIPLEEAKETIKETPVVPELIFDDSVIKAAQQESDELLKIFETYEIDESAADTHQEKNVISNRFHLEELEGNQEEDQEEVNLVEVEEPSTTSNRAIGDREIGFLKQFSGIFLPINKGAQYAADNGADKDDILSSINTYAASVWGSPLIEEFRGNYRIVEEHLAVFEDIQQDRFQSVPLPIVKKDSTEHVLDTPLQQLDNDTEKAESNFVFPAPETSGGYSEFIEELTEVERYLLGEFETGELNVARAKQLTKSKGAMINNVVSSINEKANEHLGDNLLEIEGDQYLIYEEFMNVLDKLKGSV